jgi:YVTN family beta-propeller protein
MLLAALAIIFLSAIAYAGPKVYVGNFKDNTVSVIDTATNAVVATIPVAAGPHGMSMSSDNKWLYVSGDGSTLVSVIDTATDSVVRAIEVGKSPHGAVLSPDNKYLLVAVNGESKVVFVDTAAQMVVSTIPIGKPHTIAVRPDGKIAYVSSQEPGRFSLVEIDLIAREVLRSIPIDKTPRDLEYGYTGKAVYFTKAGTNAIEVLSPAKNKVIAEIPTGVSPHYANYVRNAMAGLAVVQGPGEVLLFDPKTNKPIRSIKVGEQPHWLAVSQDGKVAFVTNEGANTLSIVDIASGNSTVVAVGNQPRKVVVQQMAGDKQISISDFMFLPDTVTIKVGDSVVWKNNDGAPHAIAFLNKTPGSDSIFPGKTFRKTFDKAGTYEYYCSIHEYMTGKIVVNP